MPLASKRSPCLTVTQSSFRSEMSADETMEDPLIGLVQTPPSTTCSPSRVITSRLYLPSRSVGRVSG